MPKHRLRICSAVAVILWHQPLYYNLDLEMDAVRNVKENQIVFTLKIKLGLSAWSSSNSFPY